MNGQKVFAHSPGGWLLPCSYIDPNQNIPKEKITQDLFSEKLKIENVDDIEEILFSDEWLKLINIISTSDIENLPQPCKKYCINNNKNKIKILI
jgi:hypothetical protein